MIQVALIDEGAIPRDDKNYVKVITFFISVQYTGHVVYTILYVRFNATCTCIKDGFLLPLS